MGVEYKLEMRVVCDQCSQQHWFTLDAGEGSFLKQEIDTAEELYDLEVTGWELTGSPYESWKTTCPICVKKAAQAAK